MKLWPLLLMLIATPCFAQSFRGPDQRPWRQSNATKVNNAAVPASAVALGSNSSSQVVAATVQGTGDTKVMLASGSFTTGHALVADANGGASDSGATPAASTFNTAMASTGVMVNYGGL